MATHSWKIPWTEKPGRLQSMGSQRVGHDWATSLSLSLSVYFRASFISQWVKNSPAAQETPVRFVGQEDPWRRNRLPTPVFLGFPVAQLVKNPPAMRETWVPSLCWEDPLEKGTATHSFSGLENSMDCIVHGFTKSQTRLSDFHFTSVTYTSEYWLLYPWNENQKVPFHWTVVRTQWKNTCQSPGTCGRSANPSFLPPDPSAREVVMVI